MAARPFDDSSPRGGRGGARADRTVVKMRRRSRSMDPGMRFEEEGGEEQGNLGGSPRPGPTFVRGGATSPRSHTTLKRGGPPGGPGQGNGPGTLGPRPQPNIPSNGPTPAPIPRTDRNGSVPSRGTAPAPQPRTPPASSTTTTTTVPSKSVDPSDKKGMIINEIITTERDYVRDMEMVINVFYLPLKNETILEEKELRTLFSNLETIVNVNKQLLAELEKIESNSGPKTKTMGDVFTSMSAYLKMYIPYCADQPRVLALLEHLRQNNEKFCSFLQTAEQGSHCRGLNFGSFIIKPIQRICKYPLFIKELLRVTPEEDSDYKSLVTAQQQIESVTSYINEGKRTAENQQKIVDIQNSVEGVGDLAGPSRKYVREGPLNQIQNHKPHARHLFLLTDLLILAKPKKNDYELVVKCALDETRIIIVADTEEVKHAFEINVGDKIYKLSASSLEELNDWVRDIKMLIKEFQKKKAKERQEAMGNTTGVSASAVISTGNASTILSASGSKIEGKSMSALDRMKNTFRMGGGKNNTISSSTASLLTASGPTPTSPTLNTSPLDSPKPSRAPPLTTSQSMPAISVSKSTPSSPLAPHTPPSQPPASPSAPPLPASLPPPPERSIPLPNPRIPPPTADGSQLGKTPPSPAKASRPLPPPSHNTAAAPHNTPSPTPPRKVPPRPLPSTSPSPLSQPPPSEPKTSVPPPKAVPPRPKGKWPPS